MTKIKVDIESDSKDNIVSAKILLKYDNGSTDIEDVEIDTKPQVRSSSIIEEGIDPAFEETY